MKKKKIITKQQVNCIVKKYKIRIDPFSIRDDGFIDVNGNVKICYTNLQKLPLKFRNVYGDFFCHSNKLTSLKGSPVFVAGDFNCYGNCLDSLKYAPKEVGGDFSCHENSLTSLKGSPKIINGNFNCFLNQITTLKNGPIKVNGSYYAYHNELISLEGASDFVGGSFHVGANEFSNLVGCPKVIVDTFSFDNTVTSLFMGNRNCEVNRVEIQNQEGLLRNNIIQEVVTNNQRHLPIVFKYNRLLEVWDGSGNFNESEFNDIISDIKEGLR